jgi:hypothetical protein
MTLFQEMFGAVGADKTCAAGNEDFHGRYYSVFNNDWRLRGGPLKQV